MERTPDHLKPITVKTEYHVIYVDEHGDGIEHGIHERLRDARTDLADRDGWTAPAVGAIIERWRYRVPAPPYDWDARLVEDGRPEIARAGDLSAWDTDESCSTTQETRR